MPQSLQDIRRRIRSVQNTEKITAAMKMVAASKLRRAQERAQAARPYAERLRQVMLRLAENAGEFQHPLLAAERAGSRCVLLMTADRGLAGPYNTNLIRATSEFIGARSDVGLVTVGRKGRDHFVKRGYGILAEFVNLGDEARWEAARAIAREVIKLFLDGRCADVYAVYPRFVNALTNRPEVVRILPLGSDQVLKKEGGWQPPYIFEPNAASVLERLLPHYVETIVFRALLEAKASEHGARMAAMDGATKNAGDMIRQLTLVRNRVRQAAITKELAEIVGGANAQRLRELEAIVEAVRASIDESLGEREAEIQVARSLSPREVEAITVALERETGKKVRLAIEVRPELIGGARVIVGGRVLDGSLVGQLERLRATFAGRN